MAKIGETANKISYGIYIVAIIIASFAIAISSIAIQYRNQYNNDDTCSSELDDGGYIFSIIVLCLGILVIIGMIAGIVLKAKAGKSGSD